MRAVRRWFSDAFELYRLDSRDAASIRAELLDGLMRILPLMAAANFFNAGIVTAALAHHGWRRAVFWVLLSSLPSIGMLYSHRRWQLVPRKTVSRRLFRRGARDAALLGLVWGVMPALWFGDASASERVFIAGMYCGMMCGGIFVLAPLPLSALSYFGTISVLNVAVLVLQRESWGFTALMIVNYGASLSLGSLAIARRSTALLRAQRETRTQTEFVSVLLRDFESHASEALWQVDGQGALTHPSDRLTELLGRSATELQGADLIAQLARRGGNASALLDAALREGVPFRSLRVELGTLPSLRHWTITGKPLFDDHGVIQGWRGVITDVTDELAAQAQVLHLAHHDVLTDLPNRGTFKQRLGELLAQGEGGALLAVDLDRFKAVNDTQGHAAGDELLRQVAARLTGALRPSDVVARLGGDEFAALVVGAVREPELMQFAQRVVQQLQRPFAINGRLTSIGGSVGVAVLGQHGHSVEQLTANADMALYAAKGRGRGRAVLYTAELGQAGRRRLQLEDGLRHAVLRDQLSLLWQPVFDAADGSFSSAEALLRWHHPAFGDVTPEEFVPVAEGCGQIELLGQWVLEQACQTSAQRWPGCAFSVNVSPMQLRSGDLPRQVQEALLRHGVAARCLELEITESLFVEDSNAALAQLQSLRELGVRVALDDFGVGYSSLSYLRRFPFDTLKIDRSFVRELPTRHDARMIVRTICALAAGLGVRTVAEGVETAEQRARLLEAGCDLLQGHLLGQPLPAERLQAVLAG